MQWTFVQGIDLGGTFIKYGLVAEDGRIIEKGKVPTSARVRLCGNAERDRVCRAGHCGKERRSHPLRRGRFSGRYRRRAGVCRYKRQPRLGKQAVCAGFIGIARRSRNARQRRERGGFRRIHMRSGQRYKSVVLVTLGTGVGSGIVLNGELFEGCEGAESGARA